MTVWLVSVFGHLVIVHLFDHLYLDIMSEQNLV